MRDTDRERKGVGWGERQTGKLKQTDRRRGRGEVEREKREKKKALDGNSRPACSSSCLTSVFTDSCGLQDMESIRDITEHSLAGKTIASLLASWNIRSVEELETHARGHKANDIIQIPSIVWRTEAQKRAASAGGACDSQNPLILRR